MKRALILIVVFFLSFPSFSQDLILTTEGDSIHCRITKVKSGFIYFTFKHGDEFRSTLLPVSGVKDYQYSYFPESEVPKEKIIGFENYPHFRLALNGGYSYETARVGESVPADFKNYVKELKSGYHYGADLSYYFTEFFGCGIKSCFFKSSNSMDNVYIENSSGVRKYGKMSDNITVSYIGPAFSTRLFNHSKSNSFNMNLSMGYMAYSDNKVIVDPFKITASTVGFVYELGYDIGLKNNMSLGFQISLISGTLTKYSWDDGTTKETVKLESNQYESLGRIDFSVGLRLHR